MGRIQLYKEIMECLIYSHSVLIGKHMAAIICRTVEDITAIAHVSTLTKKAEVLLPSQEPVLTTGWVCCAAPLVPCPSRLGLDQTEHYVPSSQTTWICSVPSAEYWGMRAASSFLHGLKCRWGTCLQWIQLDNKGSRTGCVHLPAALFLHCGKRLGASSPLWRKNFHISLWRIVSDLAQVYAWEETWKFGASFTGKFLGLRLHAEAQIRCSGI